MTNNEARTQNQVTQNPVTDNQPAENQLADNQLADNQLAENQPAENQPTEDSTVAKQSQPEALRGAAQTRSATLPETVKAVGPLDGAAGKAGVDETGAVQRPTAAAATIATTGTQPARSSANVPLPEQFRLPLAYLRSLGEGTHRLTIRIDPETIGPVRIVADVGSDLVKVALHAATEAGRTLLREALPELRSELASQSPRAQLDLGGSTGGREQPGRQRGDATATDHPAGPARDRAHESARHRGAQDHGQVHVGLDVTA